MKMLLLPVLALLPLLTHQQCLTSDDSKLQTDPNSRLALYTGQQAFSFDMLRRVNDVKRTENIFFSPFSTYNALLLAYFGAANATESSLKTTLHIPVEQDKLGTMQAYRFEKFYQAFRTGNGSASYELSSSNRLYFANEVELRECITHLFDDELQKLDFAGDAEAARGKINSWVEDETRRHIKDLIPAGKISSATQLVLVNAAYFKGLWQSRFQLESTRKDVFYISHTKQTLVSMMRQKGTFNYLISERLGAHVLELPYKGDAISMYILLPPFAKSNGVDAIISQLTEETLKELLDEDDITPRQVEIAIPKFSIEQTLELTPILEKMGVGDLFQSSSDLSGFTGKPGLSLDEATHKAKIEVDEQGTTAAAATAVFSFRISRPLTPARFIANHPFVYFLYDKVAKTVLFTGVYRSPKKSTEQ